MQRILGIVLMMAVVTGALAAGLVGTASPCGGGASSSRAVAASSCCCPPTESGACGQAAGATPVTAGGCCEIAMPARSNAGVVPTIVSGASALRDFGPATCPEPVAPTFAPGDARPRLAGLAAPPPSPRALHTLLSVFLV